MGLWCGPLSVLAWWRLAAVIGTFVVLKGLAFMGDAIAHTALPVLPSACCWVFQFT